MADYGIRISQSGVDALTGPDSSMILTSKYSPIKLIGVATVTLNFQANQTNADSSVFYLGGPGRGGASPGVGAGDIQTPVATAYAVYPFLFANTTSSQYFRSNVGFYSGSNYISAYCFASYFDAGGGLYNPGATLGAVRTSSSTTWPGAYSFSVKLYIMAAAS